MRRGPSVGWSCRRREWRSIPRHRLRDPSRSGPEKGVVVSLEFNQKTVPCGSDSPWQCSGLNPRISDRCVAQTCLGGMPKPNRASFVSLCISAIWEEKTYHYKRCNDPIDNNAEAQLYPYLPMCEHAMQRLIFDLAQYGIHHDQETNSCSKPISIRTSRWYRKNTIIPIGTDTLMNLPF